MTLRLKVLIGVFCILIIIAAIFEKDNKPLETPIIANTQQIANTESEMELFLKSSQFIYSDLINDYKEINKAGTKTFNIGRDVVVTGGNVKTLTVEYDKKWILKNTLYLTKEEVKKYKNELDTLSVYWKNNKIQAYIIERYYVIPKQYKVTDIFDRNYILQLLNKKETK